MLVLREMPEAEQNLVWNLFSSDQGRIAVAFHRIQPRQQSWSSLVNQLLSFYGLEGLAMPYTMEDLEREVAERILRELPLEKRLEGLTLEERLKGFSTEEVEDYLRRLKAAEDQGPPDPPNQPS